MKERPILFSDPMVRAIIDGDKTQTRRLVKGFALELLQPDNFTPEYVAMPENGNSPYGFSGDRLWVRECWAYHQLAIGAAVDSDGPFVYRATDSTQHRLCDKWRPSIHMPRYACRLELELTGVRIERLQDISDDDARAEGVAEWARGALSPQGQQELSRQEGFELLWKSINGAESWDANPWVWVVEFRRISA